MAPTKKSKSTSHQTQPKGTAYDAVGDKEKRVCPMFDKERTPSKLTRGEMQRAFGVYMSTLDLDLCNPEKSKWLAQNFEELRSQDSDHERRLYTLNRLNYVLVQTSLKKSRPEKTADLSAYMLEQGILNEITVRLRAAQTAGDFYLISESLLLGDLGKLSLGVLDQSQFMLSKVLICCDTLASRIADSRTVRFIRKAIPDLITILESIYLSNNSMGFAKQDKEVSMPLAVHNYSRMAALFTLGALATISTAQDKSLIARRKVLLQQVLTDSLEGTDFSRLIIVRLITCFSHLYLLPVFHYSLVKDLVRLCFKIMEVAESIGMIEVVFNILARLSQKGKLTVAQLSSPESRKAFLTPLLAVAGSPLKQEPTIRPCLRQLICAVDKGFAPLFDGEDPSSGFWNGAAAYPGAAARMSQLCKMCGANQSRAQEEKSGGQNVRVWVMTQPEEFEARRKPCRKCSRSSCPNSKSAPRQSMLCSKCRLAIYCSKECQRLAWKEGHRDRCRPAGCRISDKGADGKVGSATSA